MSTGLIDRQKLYDALESLGLSQKLDSIKVQSLWKRYGSIDRKTVEMWLDSEGRRIDLFILS